MKQAIGAGNDLRIAHQLIPADDGFKKRFPAVEGLPNQTVNAIREVQTVLAIPFEVSKEQSLVALIRNGLNLIRATVCLRVSS